MDYRDPPQVRRARDLPELRLWLLDMWQMGHTPETSGPFALQALASPQFLAGDQRFTHLNPLFDYSLAARAKLWWITPEMSRLVAHAAESLPPTTLTEDLIPLNQVVYAWFAEPLTGPDTNNPEVELTIQAIGWQRAQLASNITVPHISVALYGVPSKAQDRLVVPFYPAGRTDWAYGVDTETTSFPEGAGVTERRLASMAQDRRWLAALTLLAQQPVSESHQDGPTNKAALRRLRKAGNFSTDVRVLDLNRTTREPSEPGEGRGKVEHDHRWMVGADTGGFWKQVVYGPGRAYRYSKWIMPYIAGPEDKPLKLKDTVRRVGAPKSPPQ